MWSFFKEDLNCSFTLFFLFLDGKREKSWMGKPHSLLRDAGEEVVDAGEQEWVERERTALFWRDQQQGPPHTGDKRSV